MHSADKYDPAYFLKKDRFRLSSARIILNELFKHYRPHSAVDFGCGLGHWLWACQELGVEKILGYDGNRVPDRYLKIDPKFFICTDFEKIISPAPPRADLAISIEVAEHLRSSTAKNFVETITNCSDIILFSAAAPYQGGLGHSNEQPPAYWATLFGERGYLCFDFLRDLIWENEKCQPSHRQNILLYVKQGQEIFFTKQGLKPTPRPLLRYHPRFVQNHFKGRYEFLAFLRTVQKSFLKFWGIKLS